MACTFQLTVSDKEIADMARSHSIATVHEFIEEHYKTIHTEYQLLTSPQGLPEHYHSLYSLLKSAFDKNISGKNVVIAIGNGHQFSDSHVQPLSSSNIVVANVTDACDLPVICIGIRYSGLLRSNEEAKQEALAVIQSLPVKPTTIIDTGTSFQAHWSLIGYGIFGPALKGEFPNDRRLCSLISEVHHSISKAAAQAGLEMEPIVAEVHARKRYCSLNMYAMIPGLSNYVFDEHGVLVEKYNIEIVEQKVTHYTIDCFANWIDIRRNDDRAHQLKGREII